jgi:sugar lactone lactonase YvrE
MVSSVTVYDAIGCIYDSTNNKVVYGWRQGTSSGLKVIVATVSGTSLTFGSPTAIDTGNNEDGASMVYDTSANKVLFAYSDANNSQYATGIVGTISGQAISFGTKTVIHSSGFSLTSMAYDSIAQKVVLAYRGNIAAGYARVATISGTGVSYGAEFEFQTGTGGYYPKSTACAYDVASNKTVIGWAQNTGGNGVACTATISGTSLAFGTSVTCAATNIANASNPISLVYDANAQQVLAVYTDATNSNSGRLNALSVSGSTITVGTQAVWNATASYYTSLAYDSTAKKTIIAFGNNNVDGEALVYSPASTNLSATTFIGITDAAISSAASGSVTIKGGISSNVTGLTANSNYYVQTDGSLNTATSVVNYDITNASFTQAFSVSSQDSAPQGVAFNTDGTKMFITGAQGQDVNEYALSTGFDVSTASFTDAFSVSAQDTAPAGIAFNADGTKMFIVGNTGDDVNEYTLSGGFDVSTASFVDSFDVSGQETGPWGLAFNPTGTKMFVCGNASDNVNEYALSAGFDVSTASFTVAFSIGSQDTGPLGLAFNTAGTQMFVLGQAGKDVNEYALSTGFDVSTASFVSTFSVASQETYPNNIAFSSSGAKMFVTGTNVNQYATTSTATNSTTVLAGRALSSTSINLDYTT